VSPRQGRNHIDVSSSHFIWTNVRVETSRTRRRTRRIYALCGNRTIDTSGLGDHSSIRLTLAAITAVFTINHVAKTLGEDEDWLHELSIDMFPEDGCLHVYGVGEDG
jgi:hypothetical protein